MDHYQTLGVQRSCTLQELKQAYKRLAIIHHPDRRGGNGRRMQGIVDAYRELHNELVQRAAQDATEAPSSGEIIVVPHQAPRSVPRTRRSGGFPFFKTAGIVLGVTVLAGFGIYAIHRVKSGRVTRRNSRVNGNAANAEPGIHNGE